MKKTTKKSHLLLIIVILFWYAQYVYVPYQNPYLISIHVSVHVVGVIIGAYGISQLLLRLPMGILADLKNQHKFFILLGSALAGFASVFRVISPNGLGFLVGNIISGFASATWISFMVLFLSFYPKSRNAAATCKIIMADNLGMFLAFLTSTLLFERYGMLLLCILSIISGFIAFLLATQLKYPHRVVANFSPHLLLRVFKNHKLIFFAFLALIQQGIQMATTMSFTNQIIKQLGASSFSIGLSSIIYMLSSVLFAQLGASRWREKLSIATWIIISFLLLILYCLMVPLMQSITAIFVLQIIPGIATGILFSFLTSQAMCDVPHYMNSTAMGLFQAIYAIGMTLFPIMVGYLSHLYSLQFAYAILAATALIGLGLFLFYLKKHHTKFY
ncbi:MFS transporter [Orbaceae bacterium ESL0727]|nr:MFS transporter [Orbaceae bacterium ESL0727]